MSPFTHLTSQLLMFRSGLDEKTKLNVTHLHLKFCPAILFYGHLTVGAFVFHVGLNTCGMLARTLTCGRPSWERFAFIFNAFPAGDWYGSLQLYGYFCSWLCSFIHKSPDIFEWTLY